MHNSPKAIEFWISMHRLPSSLPTFGFFLDSFFACEKLFPQKIKEQTACSRVLALSRSSYWMEIFAPHFAIMNVYLWTVSLFWHLQSFVCKRCGGVFGGNFARNQFSQFSLFICQISSFTLVIHMKCASVWFIMLHAFVYEMINSTHLPDIHRRTEKFDVVSLSPLSPLWFSVIKSVHAKVTLMQTSARADKWARD